MSSGGLTNEEYTTWINQTAFEECGLVTKLTTIDSSSHEHVYEGGSTICDFMQNVGENEISDLVHLTFEGVDSDDIPWEGVDSRVTTNLERTDNIGDTPNKLKRPIGH